MEHKVLFLPATAKEEFCPNDVRIMFHVIGSKGVVEFDLSTNWFLPKIMARRLEHMKRDLYLNKGDFILRTWIDPNPVDVCYYSLKQLSEDDTFFEDGVSYIFDNKPCYYGYRYEKEKNGVWTKDYVCQGFVENGDSFVWEFLEMYYKKVFGSDQ